LEGRIHPVQQGTVFCQRAGGVDAGAVQVVGAELLLQRIIWRRQGFLGDDIDHTAGLDPPIQDRRWTLEHFETLYVGKLLGIDISVIYSKPVSEQGAG